MARRALALVCLLVARAMSIAIGTGWGGTVVAGKFGVTFACAVLLALAVEAAVFRAPVVEALIACRNRQRSETNICTACTDSGVSTRDTGRSTGVSRSAKANAPQNSG